MFKRKIQANCDIIVNNDTEKMCALPVHPGRFSRLDGEIPGKFRIFRIFFGKSVQNLQKSNY